MAKTLLDAAAFEDGLKGWRSQGEAEFSLDAAGAREGHAAARVTVAADAALKWQQLRRTITEDIQPGDEIAAAVWVRAPGLADGTGAYLALEFLGAAGERVGIAHSKVGMANGGNGWEKLTAAGSAPDDARAICINLVLNSHGSAWFADAEAARVGRIEAWPDLGDARREFTVRTGEVVLPRFGGVGFHAFHHSFPASQTEIDTVIAKRWREVNPSFARMNDNYDWDDAHRDRMAEYLRMMKETGTEVYVATWNPEELAEGEERRQYAREVVDNLEYLVRKKGATNIRFYCMSNELSLKGWGKMAGDLPKFRDYHRALFNELRARKLDIQLLATDASPLDWWHTIDWATKNMDDITGVYGGHHYVNDRSPEDERFYPWFLGKLRWGAGMAHAKGKEFILGEFGGKQDGRTINGVKMDACIYFGTPQEAVYPLQMAEATIAALNAGVYALGYWTFMDCPDEGFGKSYQNKWGLFKCSGDDRSTRPLYYSYGLLSKFFRGPATVFAVSGSDPRLRVAAVQHHGTGTWSIAVVNRNKRDVPLSLSLDGKPVTAAFRKYVYDPAHAPQHPFGDLQDPAGKVQMRAGRLEDTLGAGTLAIYTTAYDDQPPATVKGVKVEPASDGKERVSWRSNAEPDLCYYRVYRSREAGFTPAVATQIGSTIATGFLADAGGGPWHYKVLAVDQSGNPSN